MSGASPESTRLHILLDGGYGIPREARPRQEKVFAISKQIANFLTWQQQQRGRQGSLTDKTGELAPVTVIGCTDDDMKTAILERLRFLLVSAESVEGANDVDAGLVEADDDDVADVEGLPSHFSFARDEEHEMELLEDAVYLSPDAPMTLNPSQAPPGKVIVGLLIDRRVQINRSLYRSEKLNLVARRWPMDVLSDEYHPQEPLNVDTILEALQQWTWNSDADKTGDVEDDTAFVEASMQAFRHHAERHPARPKHR